MNDGKAKNMLQVKVEDKKRVKKIQKYMETTALFSFIEFTGEVAASIIFCIFHPSKFRKREFINNMNSCGTNGMPVTMLICFLMGIILAYQAAVQIRNYGADRFLPMLVGCTIVRELGPLMVAVVATGRCGSAFAAEIATMKISEELDAMKTMGISPARFIVVPKLTAMLIVLPLLTIIGDFIGIFGGFIIAKLECGMLLDSFISLTRSGVDIKYFVEGVIKSFIFAVLVTHVGCLCGFRTGNDAIAVGRSTTTAVVYGILAVIIADSILAKFFADIYNM